MKLKSSFFIFLIKIKLLPKPMSEFSLNLRVKNIKEGGMWRRQKKRNLSTEKHVKLIISEKVLKPLPEIIPQARLVEDLEADSLDTVEILMALEDEFDLSIPDSEGHKLKTVGDILKYIDEKI